MRRALQLAVRGWGRVAPNPMVGALVVRDGRVIGEGWHERYGEAHAEINALRAAGDAARGARLYVTLEPCSHHGKTPPCTEAILRAGIVEVVYAAADPNPRAGGGGAFLAENGVAVRGGVEAEASRRIDPVFYHRHERGRCFLALKLALSLDARLTRAPRTRTQLSGPAAQRFVHRLRAGFDAVMVGSGTVTVDDPLLTVRGDVQPRLPPKRVVVDTAARLPPQSRLVRTVAEAPVWLFCSTKADGSRRAALERLGVRTFGLPLAGDGVSLNAVLETLWQEGVGSVLCEGGARLAAALLAGGHVTRQYLLYAPLLLGQDGVAAFPLPAEQVGAPWQVVQVRRHGADVLVVLDPAEAG